MKVNVNANDPMDQPINSRFAVKGAWNYQTFTPEDRKGGYPEIFKKNGELRKGWHLTDQL